MQDAVTPLSEPEAIDLVKTCFASATERDIYTVSFYATCSLLKSRTRRLSTKSVSCAVGPSLGVIPSIKINADSASRKNRLKGQV